MDAPPEKFKQQSENVPSSFFKILDIQHASFPAKIHRAKTKNILLSTIKKEQQV